MKASNIFQKLKSAGVGNPDGVSSKKPVVKGLGVQSPAKMKKSPIKKDGESMTPYSVKDGKGTFHGPKVSYDMAYKNRDKKVYGDMSKAEYIKESKRQTKSFESTGKFDVPKAKTAKQAKAKQTKVSTIKSKGVSASKAKDPKANVDVKPTSTKTPKVTKTDTAKKSLGDAKQSVKDARSEVKDTNKAKRIQKRADKKAKKAKRIKDEGGTRVGNALRGMFKKKDKKKDDGPVKMKKSAMKMKKPASTGKTVHPKGQETYPPAKKKESAMKMAKKSPAKKALVGKQGNLPEHLKAKIKAAPGKMKKSAAKMKKAPAKMKMKK